MSKHSESTRVTVPALQKMKRAGKPITMLTCYDATFARLLDACDVDVLLVGDSLGMVIQGEDNTLGVTLEHVIYHTRAVLRGTERAHVVADMPFMSYQTSDEEGLRNAGRLIKEGGAHSVKIEGGRRHASLVRRLTEVGIPVMGHLGLTPQSVNAFGGYKVQGRRREQSRVLVEDALALQDAGCYAIVLEAVPRDVGRHISETLDIPTIGIGAGPDCDGQVLVIYDLLGMDEAFKPKFVKRFDSLAGRIRRAVGEYVEEVRARAFPDEEHSFARSAKKAKASASDDEPSAPAQGKAVSAVAAAGGDDDDDNDDDKPRLAETIPLYPGVRGK
ncbi:MAG: 3-methyl-2-oxobutanoate hydroxymethyltransferase [Myxococcales bacterium]|nr:3-methyl-2-oxobutanoate hydroxymethyltransferase [Myxococcales bacterium]